MDSRKNGNLAKLVAFFLIVTVLVMAIAFSVSGWQGDTPKEPDSGDSPLGENADENTDGETDNNAEPERPAYTHYISGLEITEEESLLKPLCVIYDSDAPLYGISSAMLTVEIPIEGSDTRLLVFTDKATEAGKLGALAPTRDYITNIASFFGAVPVYLGNDDRFPYSAISQEDDYIDFAEIDGYCYTEYGMYNYTNADLLHAYIQNNGIGMVMSASPDMPYDFSEDNEAPHGTIKATTALIQFDKSSTTELIYSASTGKYKIQKNTRPLTDKLDDTAPSYDNALILFSNAITHETADATELIIDTLGGGEGFYLNDGLATEISWTVSDEGNLELFDADGNKLLIKRGSSYIAFAKASMSSSTKLS